MGLQDAIHELEELVNIDEYFGGSSSAKTEVVPVSATCTVEVKLPYETTVHSHTNDESSSSSSSESEPTPVNLEYDELEAQIHRDMITYSPEVDAPKCLTWWTRRTEKVKAARARQAKGRVDTVRPQNIVCPRRTVHRDEMQTNPEPTSLGLPTALAIVQHRQEHRVMSRRASVPNDMLYARTVTPNPSPLIAPTSSPLMRAKSFHNETIPEMHLNVKTSDELLETVASPELIQRETVVMKRIKAKGHRRASVPSEQLAFACARAVVLNPEAVKNVKKSDGLAFTPVDESLWWLPKHKDEGRRRKSSAPNDPVVVFNSVEEACDDAFVIDSNSLCLARTRSNLDVLYYHDQTNAEASEPADASLATEPEEEEPLKLDRLGRPLNFGNYVNGCLCTVKAPAGLPALRPRSVSSASAPDLASLLADAEAPQDEADSGMNSLFRASSNVNEAYYLPQTGSTVTGSSSGKNGSSSTRQGSSVSKAEDISSDEGSDEAAEEFGNYCVMDHLLTPAVRRVGMSWLVSARALIGSSERLDPTSSDSQVKITNELGARSWDSKSLSVNELLNMVKPNQKSAANISTDLPRHYSQRRLPPLKLQRHLPPDQPQTQICLPPVEPEDKGRRRRNSVPSDQLLEECARAVAFSKTGVYVSAATHTKSFERAQNERERPESPKLDPAQLVRTISCSFEQAQNERERPESPKLDPPQLVRSMSCPIFTGNCTCRWIEPEHPSMPCVLETCTICEMLITNSVIGESSDKWASGAA